VPTHHSKHFFKVDDLPITVWDDADEWRVRFAMNWPKYPIAIEDKAPKI
jgi:hypothetical protein